MILVFCAAHAIADADVSGLRRRLRSGGTVTVDELIKGVNIALGTTSVDTCQDMDANGDGAVTVDELVAAVNCALNGCASAES